MDQEINQRAKQQAGQQADQQFDDGLNKRKQVMGDAFVDKAFASADAFTAPLQEFVTRNAWGTVWCRDGLDMKTRSLITLSMLTALGRAHEIRGHVRGAVNNGCTEVEIREALLQAAVTRNIRKLATGQVVYTAVCNETGGMLDDARKTIARYRDEYGTNLLKSYMVGNRQQRQWVVEASREMGMMPTTEGGSDSKMNITHVLRGRDHVPNTEFQVAIIRALGHEPPEYVHAPLLTFGDGGKISKREGAGPAARRRGSSRPRSFRR